MSRAPTLPFDLIVVSFMIVVTGGLCFGMKTIQTAKAIEDPHGSEDFVIQSQLYSQSWRFVEDTAYRCSVLPSY